MKRFLSTLIVLGLTLSSSWSQISGVGSVPGHPATPSLSNPKSAGTNNPAISEEAIIKEAEVKTEWVQARNPFRFEVNESPINAPERVEQMQLIGYTKMPDHNGIEQTYVFVTKTADLPGAQKEPNPKSSEEIYTLRALPDKLDEQTVTTDEQAEECSIALGGEQLWFLGIVQTNAQAVGIFLPDSATYPIKEEQLRSYSIRDSLQDLQIRVTRAGEKITTDTDATPRRPLRSRTKSPPVAVPPKPLAPKLN